MLRKIDENGYFIEDVLLQDIPFLVEIISDEDGNSYEKVVTKDILNENGEVIRQEPVISPYYIDVPCQEGFYIPRWDGTTWTEGATQEYIDSLLNITPEPTTEEKLEELATNVNDALYAIMMLSIE